jgi:transcription initiation factor TFIIIB Brf1 subunit/transcription initiation factor TFIIB
MTTLDWYLLTTACIAALVLVILIHFAGKLPKSPKEKAAIILQAMQDFGLVIELRCQEGAYFTLAENYAKIQECYDTLLQDKVYKVLDLADKFTVLSIIERTVRMLSLHNQPQYTQLKAILDKFLEKLIEDHSHQFGSLEMHLIHYYKTRRYD